MKIRTTAMGVALAALSLALFATPAVQAQTHPVPSRVTAKVEDTRTVELKGNVHPLARPEFDRGAVADSQPMTRMLLTLQRSAEQETALQQLMDAQQTKGSANYHAWLTPEQFGKQFGPSDADVQAVTDWLTRQGFQVSKVAAGRGAIEFSGNVAQVRNAFHTEIHKFAVNGEEHMANASEPLIPAALAPVVKGVAALNTFPRKAHLHNRGVYRWQRDTGQIKPLFTFGTNPVSFAMAPGDFAKIYNIPATCGTPAAPCTGTGQTIAVIGQSNIDAQDVIDFRNLFGLPQNFTQANNVIVNGPDPGLSGGDEGESDLDVEWAGAVAPDAKILLVTSSTTLTNPSQITAGIDLSALYAVDNNLASVISESYGACEPSLGSAGNLFYNALWEQAAAQGITVVVSSGDSGSAGCDPDPTQGSPNAAVDGLAVSGIASTPFNVAVGGTDFDATAQPVTPPNQFWSAANGPNFASALMYIPETTWDDSLCAINFPAACNSVDPQGFDLVAGSGGPSNCAIFTGSNCNKGYPIPAYQAGFHTTQFPTVRTIPDVSLFASNGQNGVALITCQADANLTGASCSLGSPFTDFVLVGGTSAATPPFGAIVALLNQASGGQRQGNVNFGLYFLAAHDTNYTGNLCNSSLPATPNAACIFNDVTKGNIGVACVKGSTSNVDGTTTWCQGAGPTFGVTVANGSVAYGAGPQYDLATGLGSVNVANLITKWSTFVRTATTTTVTNPTGGTPSGTSFTATVTVTPAGATGDVSLNALAADHTVLASFGPFTLAAGTKSVTTNLLPPGTAAVSATYGGDSTHGLSTSAVVALAGTVAGANFASATKVGFVTFNANGVPSTPSTAAQSVPYGSPYGLNIAVTKSGSNTTCGFAYSGTTVPALPCPTGTIALKDGANPLNDFPAGPNFNVANTSKVSNQGFVEDGFIQLAGGSHTIVATFTTGDTNYQNSTSNTLTVTITPAATTTLVASSLGVIPAGSPVTLTAVVGSTSNSVQGPTGTVQFQAGSTNLGAPVTCTPSGADANGGASCFAQLTTTVAALYPPATGEPRPTMPLLPLLFALLSAVLFALGWRWMPERRRRTYAYAGFLAFAVLAVAIAGCGGGGGGGGGHAVTIKASYVGDTNYAASSGNTNVTVQ
ncbi:MAG TPA: protease pro-enzyme activation domain-containing protein [Candidatus Acidoferrum sp.]|nr:protease pro-enzyme activation domain-containing protein [Candidatus Acidoferrum sp.]